MAEKTKRCAAAGGWIRSIFNKRAKKKDKKIAVMSIVVVCVAYLMVGYHNIDNSQNMRFLNAYYNLELYDETLGGLKMTPIMGYKTGWIMVFGSFLTMVIVIIKLLNR